MWRRTRSAPLTDPAPDALEPHARSLGASRAVVVVATVVFLLVTCRWRPWDLFDDAGFSNDFYDEQARSFLRGRLAVRP